MISRRLYRTVWAFAAGWTALAGVAVAAQRAEVLVQTHAWARFGKGAWRQVRIVTENFDDDGKVASSSITDNTTTVEEVTPERITLSVEVTVEVAGKKFPSPPQTVQQGYAGETAGQTVSFKPLEGESLTVDGRQIDCEAQQIEILGGGNKEIIEINFSPRMMPAILKRRSTISDAASGKTTQEALTEVYSLDKRFKLLDERAERRGYRMRQVLKTDRGTTTTWSDHVPDVPGEVVAHTSQKFDDAGKLVRRTTLELVDYGVEPGSQADSQGDATRDTPRRSRRHKRR